MADDKRKLNDPLTKDDLDRRMRDEGEVLRLAEEQLEVGKREIEIGKARIRRFVTQRPVEAQVTCHAEHAEMQRRPVADPTNVRDLDWSEKTIEIVETDEQPVVTKTAHVTEEVILRRQGSDRVETVRDKVRRQQVELERLTAEGRDLRDLRRTA